MQIAAHIGFAVSHTYTYSLDYKNTEEMPEVIRDAFRNLTIFRRFDNLPLEIQKAVLDYLETDGRYDAENTESFDDSSVRVLAFG